MYINSSRSSYKTFVLNRKVEKIVSTYNALWRFVYPYIKCSKRAIVSGSYKYFLLAGLQIVLSCVMAKQPYSLIHYDENVLIRDQEIWRQKRVNKTKPHKISAPSFKIWRIWKIYNQFSKTTRRKLSDYFKKNLLNKPIVATYGN